MRRGPIGALLRIGGGGNPLVCMACVIGGERRRRLRGAVLSAGLALGVGAAAMMRTAHLGAPSVALFRAVVLAAQKPPPPPAATACADAAPPGGGDTPETSAEDHADRAEAAALTTQAGSAPTVAGGRDVSAQRLDRILAAGPPADAPDIAPDGKTLPARQIMCRIGGWPARQSQPVL